MKTVKDLIIVVIGLLTLVGTSWAAGVDYPSKPIRILVGWEAGSGTDTMLRAMAPVVQKILGQSILVDNKPGGSGVLAVELLKLAKPDGYTLVGTAEAPLTRMPQMIRVNYDPLKDFASIIALFYQPAAVLVKYDSPFKKFQDLIEYSRKDPGQLTIGIPGTGSSIHLGLTSIANQEKVKFQLVPFQGSAPTTTALLGGHVMSASFVSVAFLPQIKAGTLKALMIFGQKRMVELPEVPSSDELGYPEASNIVLVRGHVIAPKALSKTAKNKLVSAFSEATKSHEYRNLASLNGMGVFDPPLVSEDLDKYLQTLYELYGKYIRLLGLQKK